MTTKLRRCVSCGEPCFKWWCSKACYLADEGPDYDDGPDDDDIDPLT